MTAPWTDAELDDLARDYPADAHADVAALIAGARAVVALHRPMTNLVHADDQVCAVCVEVDYAASYPCPTLLALSLEETP